MFNKNASNQILFTMCKIQEIAFGTIVSGYNRPTIVI